MRAVICAAVLAAPAFAQPANEPKDGKLSIPLTVSPAAAPPILSRYLLTPQYGEKQPGSKLTGFLGVFMEQDVFFNGENQKKREEWLKLPMGQLPVAEIGEKHSLLRGTAYNPRYADMMVRLDQAARYTHVEWNEHFNLRHDGYHFLLPEVQKLRSLMQVLRLRLRCEVQEKQFDRAIVTVRSLMGLAQLLETHPTMIGYLVGQAGAFMTLDALEEMVAQPGCPNLFWSFAALQPSVLDIRNSLGGERMFLSAQFAPLLEGRPLPEADLAKYLADVEEIATFEAPEFRGTAKKLAVRATYAGIASDATKKAAAVEYLKSAGVPEEKLKGLPPLQFALIYDLKKYEDLRDEALRSMPLPFWVGRADLKAAEEKVAKSRDELVMGPALVPSVLKVRRAQARSDQRAAFLMAIEAVRQYAAANGGALPETLDDTRLPIPVDPASGRPFDYSVNGRTATLSGTNVNPEDPRTNRVYTITLRK